MPEASKNWTRPYAKGWSSDAFKRLHQSGSNARFTGVTWPGRYTGPNGDADPGKFYHRSAYQAFRSAKHLNEYYVDKKERTDKRRLRRNTVFMAHSLGNMVVSAAIQDYTNTVAKGNHAKYFILNGAVASEAYYAKLHNPYSGRSQYLVNQQWGRPDDEINGFPTECYSANWWQLFVGEEGKSAASRTNLNWRGRFRSVPERVKMVNFACSEDEVLKICEDRLWMSKGMKFGWGHFNDTASIWRILDFVDTDFSEWSWHKQEVAKGYESWTNPTFDSDLAGWGFNTTYPKFCDPQVARAIASSKKGRLVFREHPVFRQKPVNVFSETGTPPSADMIDKMLTCAIPAISVNMGALVTNEGTGLSTYDMKDMKNGWPNRLEYKQQWLHCDLKDVAYFYNFELWNRLVEEGTLK